MPTGTVSDLRSILAGVNRPTFLSLLAVVDIPQEKIRHGCPYRRIQKISRVLGIANFHYSNSVNKQRTREGLPATFQAHPRKWGVRIDGCPLVVHKGQYYLELKVEKTLDHPRYLADGRFVSAEHLEPWLPVRKESARQGTEKPIILRDYSLKNIRKLRLSKREFLTND